MRLCVVALMAALVAPSAASAQEPVNIFDTIGITEQATRANSQIFGEPQHYSLPAEEMPPSRSIVKGGPTDTQDEVWFRMPNTSGTVANLAAFHGQTIFLRPSEVGAYTNVHFFGTTTDGGPAGGDFILHYSDGSTESRTVQFRDWCNAGTATPAHHIAIGPLTHRWTETSQDGAPCGIYHVPATADEAKTLESVTLPSTTTPGNPPIQSYLMALTLEKSDGTFVTPDLGASQFPDDLSAPTSQAALDPPDAQGDDGWYKSAVEVSLAAEDEQGGSGLDSIQYRIDGGEFQDYDAPFTVSDEGNHVVEYRSRDKAGNTETPQAVPVKIDATAPTTAARVNPPHPGPSGWYDDAVTLTLRGSDGGNGSGIRGTEYRTGSGAWQTYSGPVVLDDVGTYSVAFRSTDVAGNAETAGAPAVVRVDGRAPVTRATLARNSSGAQVVTLAADDGAGGSGTTATEYRLDGGAFRPYTGAVSVSATGGHLVEYRSRDRAGNLENLHDLPFVVGSPQGSGQVPAFVALTKVDRRLKVGSLTRGLRVRATCVSAGRGTLKLTVSRSVARKLGLRSRTLAGRSVRCSDEFRISVKLQPSRSVARKLKKARGTFPATLTLRMGSAHDSQKITLRGKRRAG
jgi:hypothetical protein